MFAEGTWLVLDGGTLDLGVIRDSTHVANNTYCEFTESFYNVARVGGESVHVTSTLSRPVRLPLWPRPAPDPGDLT